MQLTTQAFEVPATLLCGECGYVMAAGPYSSGPRKQAVVCLHGDCKMYNVPFWRYYKEVTLERVRLEEIE